MSSRLSISAGLAGLWGMAGLMASLCLLAGGCGSCDGGGGFPVDARPVDASSPGTVSAAWTIDDIGGAPITCDQVGATTVLLELSPKSNAVGTTDTLTCTDGVSMSQPIKPDTYDITLLLVSGAGGTLAMAEQDSVTVRPGSNTPLAPVVFQVDARGGLAISFAALQRTSNCQAAPAGAGITTMTITLEHAGDGCEPVVFTHTRGTTMLPSYTVNCSSPAIAPCIETDELLEVTTMPSGPYTVHVSGKVNTTDCWDNDDSLRVLPGQTLTTKLNLVEQPGCPP